jgi:magnesium-transporting ATPase (P-type)
MNPLLWVLLGTSCVALALGDTVSAMVITAILLLTAVPGFYWEHKAEKALRELRQFLSRRARAYRNGKAQGVGCFCTGSG